jgi:16S rRNA (adenine1518-N6/adenine1519-N6)-dimethyltransferase
LPHIPKKRLSQNFLIDDNLSRKIVDSCAFSQGDTVLEIGCGQGAITKHILKKKVRLYGVEYDRELFAKLKAEFETEALFTLFEADILDFDFDRIPRSDMKIRVVGNLPYHISSPILFRLIDEKDRIESATVMLQKEVAERIVSKPGTKNYGILSVFCQYFAECRMLFHIPPAAFFPKPKVDSSIVRLTFKTTPEAVKNYEMFKQIVKKSFNQRRKMLRNSLSSLLENRTVDFDLRLRPEELSVNDFIHLSNLLSN